MNVCEQAFHLRLQRSALHECRCIDSPKLDCVLAKVCNLLRWQFDAIAVVGVARQWLPIVRIWSRIAVLDEVGVEIEIDLQRS